MKTVYVVFYDYAYEGYGEPEGVYMNHDKMLHDYPGILPKNHPKTFSSNFSGYVYSESEIVDEK